MWFFSSNKGRKACWHQLSPTDRHSSASCCGMSGITGQKTPDMYYWWLQNSRRWSEWQVEFPSHCHLKAVYAKEENPDRVSGCKCQGAGKVDSGKGRNRFPRAGRDVFNKALNWNFKGKEKGPDNSINMGILESLRYIGRIKMERLLSNTLGENRIEDWEWCFWAPIYKHWRLNVFIWFFTFTARRKQFHIWLEYDTKEYILLKNDGFAERAEVNVV